LIFFVIVKDQVGSIYSQHKPLIVQVSSQSYIFKHDFSIIAKILQLMKILNELAEKKLNVAQYPSVNEGIQDLCGKSCLFGTQLNFLLKVPEVVLSSVTTNL
jgi:hypothetical protein